MNWISLHPDGLEPELDSVIWRTQIEEKQFEIQFIETLDEVMDQKLKDPDYYSYEENKFDMAALRK